MSVTNLQLNVRANTARALSDFKKFSDSLDNKFLISGLKLDVIRNALSQINREFQKSIGEQGLASASSLRAAQNQAAMLTNIFKGFSEDASMAITTNISTALNNVAVRAGGTMKDVQKTLSITPFLDRNISEGARTQISQSVLEFQKNFRRAGMGDNFADVVGQFLRGETTGRDLANTGSPLGSFLGTEIMRRGGGVGFIDTPERRTQILQEILGDEKTLASIRKMARSAAGYTIILEDLNTKLFNTESGLFGSLRKIALKGGGYTTIFDEVDRLVQSVFGPSGSFSSFFKTISEVFGIGDPLQPFVSIIRFFTKISDDLSAFFRDDKFRGILGQIKMVFDELWGIFKDIYQWVNRSVRSVRENFSDISFERIFDVFKDFFRQIRTGNLDPSKTVEFIKEIGESVRGYIKKIGEYVRGANIGKETDFVTEIAGTLLTEIGKTAIVLIKELLSTLITHVPTIITSILPAINNGINYMLTEAFGEVGGKVVKFIAGFLPGPVGAIARASAMGDITGDGGNMFSVLAMGLGSILAPGVLRGGGRFFKSAGTNIRQHLSGYAYPFSQVFNRGQGGSGGFWPFGGGGPRTPGGGGGFWPFGGGGPRTPGGSGGFWPFGGGGPRTPGGGGGFWPFGGGGPRTPGGSGGFSPFGNSPTGGHPFTPSGFGWQRHNFSTNNPQFYGTTIDLNRMANGSYGAGYPSVSSGFGWQRHNFSTNYRQFGGQTIDLTPRPSGNYGMDMQSELFTPDDLVTRESKITDSEIRKRYLRRYGAKGRMATMRRRLTRNLGKGARIAGIAGLGLAGIAGLGAIFNAGEAQARTQFNPETGEMELVPQGPSTGEKIMSSLGGGMEGAMIGATIGSVVPGIGTAAGAVIGGIIGGIAPLINEQVIRSTGEFGSKLLNDLTTAGSNFFNFVGGIFTSLGDNLTGLWNNLSRGWESLKTSISTGAKNLANGFIWTVNQVLNGLTLLPRTIISAIKNIVERFPGASLIPGVKEGLDAAESASNFQLGYFYRGKNTLSTTLRREAMMSGRNAMVINSGEYVFPPDQLPVFMSAIEDRFIKSSSKVNPAGRSNPLNVQLNINLSVNSVVANPDELVNALRGPVSQIIDDAFTESSQKQLLLYSNT